jgi:chromate reductase, NAD(P)H dehydrogenase (quinone)
LIATPEHNYSIVLKNSIDWASRPHGDSAWTARAACKIGASVGTIGTARAQYHLRQVFEFLNMFAITQPEEMIGNVERFDAQANLKDKTLRDLIRTLLRHFLDWSWRIQQLLKNAKL